MTSASSTSSQSLSLCATSAPTIHASCVVLDDIGILLRGASGMGKSAMALRLIMNRQAKLVGDDRIILTLENNQLFAAPAQKLAGLLHIRGLGLQKRPFEKKGQIGLVVELVPPDSPALQDCFAPPLYEDFADNCRIPLLRLCAFEMAAEEKILLAAQTIARSGFADEHGILS